MRKSSDTGRRVIVETCGLLFYPRIGPIQFASQGFPASAEKVCSKGPEFGVILEITKQDRATVECLLMIELADRLEHPAYRRHCSQSLGSIDMNRDLESQA